MSALEPEISYLVTTNDKVISVKNPAGQINSINWDDLQTVVIETNDLSPFVPDVFWHLVGSQSRCVFPQGATGDWALVEKLQSLPGFDNEAMINAMSSTVNQEFLCWQRTVNT